MSKLICFGLLLVVLAVQCKSESSMIIMEERAHVYEAAEPDPERRVAKPSSEVNRAVATVEAGETVELLGAEYKKEYAAYRVRLNDGREGYIMSDAKFRQLSKGSESPREGD